MQLAGGGEADPAANDGMIRGLSSRALGFSWSLSPIWRMSMRHLPGKTFTFSKPAIEQHY